MKPRFPASVEREFLFRARITINGESEEIITSDCFKNVYNAVRHSLRDYLSCDSSRVCSSHFEFGYEERYEETPNLNYWYEEWHPIRHCGFIRIDSTGEYVICNHD